VCNATVDVAGRWLADHADGLGDRDVLGTDDPALQVRAGFLVSDPVVGVDVFAGLPVGDANKQYWLVVGPGLPLRATTGRSLRRRGMRADAVLMATLPLPGSNEKALIYAWPSTSRTLSGSDSGVNGLGR
jgi:hypothetical protein